MKKMIVLAAAVALSAAAQVSAKLATARRSAPVPAPSTKTVLIGASVPSVTEGGTIQFTAKQAVTWSLAPGSAGSIDAHTGVYTAPPAITAKNTSGGCPNSPNDSIFNTRVDKLPVHRNSAAWIALLNGSGINYEQAWGLSTYTSSTPRITLTTNYTPQYNGAYPIPVWPNLREEAGNYAVGYGGAGGDHHITEVDLSSCHYADIYNYAPGANGIGKASSAVSYSGLSHALPKGGTDAAGMYLQPLTLRLGELENGHINHALRFSLSNNFIRPDLTWPASANAYPYNPNGLRYGDRLRLKASAIANLSSLSPMAQTLVTQLMQYGIIVSDGGPYVSISGDQDLREDPAAIAAIKEAKDAVNSVGGLGAFEVVDESALQSDSRSGAVKINNGIVTPDDYVQVIVTPKSGGKSMTSRVALQGVGVGVPDASITVPAGATVQFSAWTSGTTKNNAVAWKTSPSLGKMTSSGSYTAPAVVKPASTTVTAYSVENPSATQTIAVHILPVASDGSIRVSDNMGPAYNYAYPGSTYGPDRNNMMWWPEPGFIASGYNYCDWGGAGGGLSSGWCNFGADVTHDVLLNNGNYRVDIYIGVPASMAGKNSSWNIGAQGQWAALGFSPVAASKGGTQPIVLSIPATVTDNRLSWTISNLIINTDNNIGPMLSGWAVVPDSSPAHLTISDANGNTSTSTVASNTTMQFSAVGWYMPHTVTWSISPQIGTISSTGLYTAPSKPQTGTVTVTATSTADPTKTARMRIQLSRGALNVNAASNRLPPSMTDRFRVDLNGRDYSNVTWSASVGSIDQKTGLYTAPDTLTANTTATIIATSNDDHSVVGSYTLNLLKNIDPIRINCGDWYAPVTDANGNVWSTDWGADGGPRYRADTFRVTGTGLDGQPLTPNSAMAAIYNTWHYSSYTPNNSFKYNFTVPNGTYQVTLLFANWDTKAHGSLFNVLANGTQVISKYDPDANGVNVAGSQTFNVTVTNKALTLTFAGIGDKQAEVNGIQIVPARARYH